MRILCFGDSNTYGYDPRSYFGSRYGPEERWVDLLSGLCGAECVNLGSNGRSIPRPGAGPAPGAGERLIVMLGTNDILSGAAARSARIAWRPSSPAVPSLRAARSLWRPPALVPGEWTGSGGGDSRIPRPWRMPTAPWPPECASTLRTPRSGAWNWPMTGCTSPARGTAPLPPVLQTPSGMRLILRRFETWKL